MNQTYQIVLILKGVVQRSDPLTISIHQDVSLFSETSCLKEERGRSHCQHQQVVFTGWIYMDVLWDYLKLLNRGLYSSEFSLHKWQAKESLQACSYAFSHSNSDCDLKKKKKKNIKKKTHKPIQANTKSLFHNISLKARKMIIYHCKSGSSEKDPCENISQCYIWKYIKILIFLHCSSSYRHCKHDRK